MKPFSNAAMKINFHHLLLLFLIPGITAAQNIDKPSIYKSIDKNGKVTYSTTPPENAEKSSRIDIPPPPSTEDIKEAQDRHERNQEAAAILDENRKKRDAITAEENRLKREKQKQLQMQRQAETNNYNNSNDYPYVPVRRPGGILPPPHRPIQLPARPLAR